MIEKHFEDLEHYHLTAAQVGIHHQRWTAVPKGTSLEGVQKLMAENQYDILPVQSEGAVTHYYATLESGKFSAGIEKREIQVQDKLYYLTQIEDVMRLFHQQDRAFFFLWDYHQVLGLISKVNLKSTPVSVYLYAQSNALEMALSQLFLLAYDEAQLTDILRENIENGSCHPHDQAKQLKKLQDSIKEHEKQKQKNQHLHFIETLGLSALLNILQYQKWVEPFGYDDKSFSTISKLIKDVRNYIAHPVRDSVSTKQMQDFLKYTRELIAVIAKAELDVHYRKTHYKVNGHEAPIEIGKPLPESLQKLCQDQQGWCFITAFNPASKSFDAQINQMLNARLKSELEALGLQVFEGQGVSTTTSDYPPEQSFWVPGLPKEKAEALGLKYGQNAVVYGKSNGNAELLKLNLKEQGENLDGNIYRVGN